MSALPVAPAYPLAAPLLTPSVSTARSGEPGTSAARSFTRMPPTSGHDPDPDLTLQLGHREVLIRDRYETASIVNDALIAIEFFIGSFYFFAQNHDPGVWLFVLGSAQLAIRPAIRLSRRITLRRMQSRRPAVGSGRSHEDPEDF